MANAMNKEITDKNSFLLNDRTWLDNLIVMERYRLGYSHSKQYPYPRRVTMHFPYSLLFFTQAGNVDVNGTVQHIDFLLPYFSQNIFA